MHAARSPNTLVLNVAHDYASGLALEFF